MYKFRDAVESYCKFGVEHHCNMCAISAACYIAGRDTDPSDMSDREIEIMFNNAVDMWSELNDLLDSINDGQKSNPGQHEDMSKTNNRTADIAKLNT